MDDLDEHLIERLRINARAPVAELARGLGLSRTTVQSRLARLERSGVIAGYQVRLSDAREGALIHALVMLNIDPKQAAAVVRDLGKLSGVRKVRSVSGTFDMVAEVEAPSMAEMDALVGEVAAATGVERASAAMVLATKLER